MFHIFKKKVILREKVRIIFDQDDVLADFLPAIVDTLRTQYCKEANINDVIDWNLKKIWGEEVNDILKQKDFFYNLKPKNDALKVFPKIYNNPNVDVLIVTACLPQSFEEKKEWVKKYFPDFPQSRVLACSEKSAFWGDYLVDDGIHNAEGYVNIGTPILYDMPHNRQCTKFHRIHNLKGLLKILDLKNEIIS